MIIVLGVPFLLGLFILSLLLRHQARLFSLWEKLALAFALGLGILTIMMYIISAISIPLTLLTILAAVAALIGLISIYLVRARTFCLTLPELKGWFSFRELKLDWLETALFSLIGLKVVFAFFAALVKPMVDVDSFVYYSLIGKGIFYTRTFFDPYLFKQMGFKPPFPFLAQGWAFIGLGQINDALAKVLSPTLFLCFLVIFFAILKRYLPRRFSLLMTFFLSGLPFLFYHAGTAYSDFPITMFYAISTFYLFLFMKEFERDKEAVRTYFFVSALLLAIAVWVKIAALTLAGINVLVLAVFLFNKRGFWHWNELKPLLYCSLLAILLAMPVVIQGGLQPAIWVISSIGTPIPAQIASQTTHPTMSLAARTLTIASIFLRKMFLYADWQLLWALLIILLVFFPKRSFAPPYIYLLTIILIDILSVFFQFETGASFYWLLDGTLFDRLMMNGAPVALFFCAEVTGTYLLFKPGDSQDKPVRQ